MTSIPALWGGILLLAVVLGISGTMYKLLGPGGWLGTLFLDGPQTGLLLFAAAAAIAALIANSPRAGRNDWQRNAFVYLCAGAGLYYAFSLIVHGNL